MGMSSYYEKPPFHQSSILEQFKTTLVQRKEADEMISLTSITGIVVVMIICIITVKFIIPRLSWRVWIRSFVRLIWKPAKKEAKTVKAEWEEANKEGPF